MVIDNRPISVKYSDERLRTLVEEFITMQKHELSFKGLCSYVLYWAKEEGQTVSTGLYESNELDAADCDRLNQVLGQIAKEGRIIKHLGSDVYYTKTKE